MAGGVGRVRRHRPTSGRQYAAADRQRGVEPAGMPDGGDQPPDRETLATRPHDHQQQRSAAALSAGDQRARSGRSRHGSCPRTSGSRSPICVARPGRSGDRRASWARARRRSAGSCAATSTRPAVQYRPFTAQRMAAARRARPGAASWSATPSSPRSCSTGCRRRWSPEQICHALREQFPGQPGRHLVPETIYQAVYRPGLGGLRRELPPRVLRTGRSRRKPHRRPERAPRPTGRHDDDRPAAGRGRRPEISRALGRRSDHRGEQPLGDRHPGGAASPVHHPAAPARRPRRPGRPRRASSPRWRTCRRSCVGR